jgi:hypothetical protein
MHLDGSLHTYWAYRTAITDFWSTDSQSANAARSLVLGSMVGMGRCGRRPQGCWVGSLSTRLLPLKVT